MAEITKRLNTRILNKVDTLENWNKSTLGLLPGEIAIATFAAAAATGITDPVCMIKIGEAADAQGHYKTFSELGEFKFYAKASDVLSACKSQEGLTAFVKNVIDNSGIATNEAMQKLAERVSDTEGAIETLNGDVETAGSVANAIKDAIDALDLPNTYALKEHEHVAEDITDFDEAVKAVKVDEAVKADKATADGDGNVITETYALKEHEHVAEDITDFDEAVKAVKVDEAVKATQDGNGDVIADTYFKKADVATTNVSAFVNDAKYQKDTEVAAAIQAAIAEINHAVFEKVDAVPAPANAATNVLYLVPEGDKLNIYAKINDEMVLIDDTDADLSGYALKSELHEHANKDLLDTYTQTEENLADAVAKKHEHANKDLLDTYTQTEENLADAVAKKHEHTFADTDVEDAIAKKHEHANADVLDGITAKKVESWDAAEQNAKDYADSLAVNYATDEQGVKADTAIQKVTTTANEGLKVTQAEGSTTVNIDIDENVTFIFDCGGSGVTA